MHYRARANYVKMAAVNPVPVGPAPPAPKGKPANMGQRRMLSPEDISIINTVYP
jgi:hypothetical protein